MCYERVNARSSSVARMAGPGARPGLHTMHGCLFLDVYTNLRPVRFFMQGYWEDVRTAAPSSSNVSYVGERGGLFLSLVCRDPIQ